MIDTTGLVGRTFGRWVVLTFVRKANPEVHNSTTIWACRCACGTEREVARDSLIKGRSLSCGCYKDERATKHGLSRIGEMYNTWDNMVQRCTKPHHPRYKDYGGRGITVCADWLGVDGIANFIRDMGPRPEGMTLDRRDNDQGYSKDNCRWADRFTQANNTRRNKKAVSTWQS